MKLFLISDNLDTLKGMRMAGIDGVEVHDAAGVNQELSRAMADKDNEIILITERLVGLCRDKIYALKLNTARPLLVEIPDRHGNSRITDTISEYVREAIGIRL